MPADSVKLAPPDLFLRFWGCAARSLSPGPKTVQYGGNFPVLSCALGDELLILDAGDGIGRLGLNLARERKGKTLRTTGLNHPGGCTGFRIGVVGELIAYSPRSRIVSERGRFLRSGRRR